MCFKIDRASLLVGSKFTVFALFYFVCNFPSTSPRGGLYLEGFNFSVNGLGGVSMEGLIFGILRYLLFE